MFIQTISNARAGRETAGRKYLPPLFAAVLFALAIYPSQAQAQVVEDLDMNVPFEFHAGNATLPAGEYRIHMMEDSDLTVMRISSANDSKTVFFQVQEINTKPTPTQSEAIFNKYGDQYFLADLFEEGSASGSQVIESRYEKAVSQQSTQAQEHVPATNQRGK